MKATRRLFKFIAQRFTAHVRYRENYERDLLRIFWVACSASSFLLLKRVVSYHVLQFAKKLSLGFGEGWGFLYQDCFLWKEFGHGDSENGSSRQRTVDGNRSFPEGMRGETVVFWQEAAHDRRGAESEQLRAHGWPSTCFSCGLWLPSEGRWWKICIGRVVFLSVRENLLGVYQIKKLCMGIDTWFGQFICDDQMLLQLPEFVLYLLFLKFVWKFTEIYCQIYIWVISTAPWQFFIEYVLKCNPLREMRVMEWQSEGRLLYKHEAWVA